MNLNAVEKQTMKAAISLQKGTKQTNRLLKCYKNITVVLILLINRLTGGSKLLIV